MKKRKIRNTLLQGLLKVDGWFILVELKFVNFIHELIWKI